MVKYGINFLLDYITFNKKELLKLLVFLVLFTVLNNIVWALHMILLEL